VDGFPKETDGHCQVASDAADLRLRQAEVDILTGAAVAAIHEREVELADGRRLEADIILWAAGVKGPGFAGGLDGLGVTPMGQLLVGPTLQTLADERIFALGDCARFDASSAGRPLPSTAQVARQQARHLASQLPAWLVGRAMQPFRYRDRGLLVSLAGYDAFGVVGHYGPLPGHVIRGRLAQLSCAMLYRLHQIEVHGVWGGALAWFAGQHESSRLRADTPGLNGPNAADTAIVTWRLEASLVSDCAAPKTVSAFGR